jgi:hypothetical protein
MIKILLKIIKSLEHYGKMKIGIMQYYDVTGNHGGEVGPSHEDFCATNKLIMVV